MHKDLLVRSVLEEVLVQTTSAFVIKLVEMDNLVMMGRKPLENGVTVIHGIACQKIRLARLNTILK